jgi:tRNA A-37 threonylcarbamoyl transferase component Bud32
MCRWQGHPPTVAELQAFSLGKLDQQRADEVESYLADHPEGILVFEATPDDAVVGHLRGAGDLTAGGTELYAAGQCGQVFARPTPIHFPPPGDPAEVLRNHPRYRPVRKLGEGGMGTVFLVEHRVMQRPVALKVIRADRLANPQAVERFHREVKAAAGLNHPNIVTAHDAEEVGGTHFLVMEYVEGVPLSGWLAGRGPLPPAEACDYVRQAALGLQYAYERGVIHRDLKPHNLMRTPEGRIKILDFGLARLACDPDVRAAGQLTDEGVVMGTADYMAPEQAEDSRTADIRADVYSLGCTLYELLAGCLPFPGGSAATKIIRHSREQSTPLGRLRPDLPLELVRVVEKMMAKRPTERYQTPGEVAAALEPFSRGEGVKRRGRRDRRAVVRVLLLLAAAAVALVVYRIQTAEGEIVLTPQSPDVEIVLLRGGREFQVIDTKTRKRVTLPVGTYDVVVKDRPEGIEVKTDRITIRRGKETLLVVERVGPGAPPAPPPGKESLPAPPGAKEPAPSPKPLAVARRLFCPGPGFSSSFSNDGRLCLASGRNGFRVWEMETGRLQREVENLPHTVTVRCMPGGKQALSSHTDGTFRRWDLATGEQLGQLHGPPEWNLIGGITPDGDRFCFVTAGSIRVWEVSTGRELFRVEPTGPKMILLASHALSPDGKRLLVCDHGGKEGGTVLRIFDVGTGKQVRLIASPLIPDNVAWGEDSRRVYLNASDPAASAHAIVCWDADTGEMLSRATLVPEPSSSQGRFFSRDGRYFGVQYPDKHLLHLYDARSGRLAGTAAAPFAGFSLSFSPDGRHAACGSRGEVILYRLPALPAGDLPEPRKP